MGNIVKKFSISFLFSILIILLIVQLFLNTNYVYASDFECHSPYRGKTIHDSQIKSILVAHQKWLNSDRKPAIGKAELCDTTMHGLKLSNVNLSYSNLAGSDLSQTKLNGIDLSYAYLVKTFFREADLTNAHLQNANMEQAILEDAQLMNANLKQVNLNHANLMRANLKDANLLLANLSNANLTGADLSGADMRLADLSHADLSGANLKDANLEGANLTSANFQNTILTNAYFSEADFKNVIFQPKLGGLPNLTSFHTVKHFQDIQFIDFNSGKAALTELRKAYSEIGVRSMERLITATIKYKEMISAWHRGGFGYMESSFNYIFFYITCNFGADPGRPLRILLVGIFLFAIPYRIALSKATRHAGIIAAWTPKRFYHWDKTEVLSKQKEQLTKIIKAQHCTTHKLRYQFHLLRLALFFSLLSVFSIGWKDVNVSNWISHLQSREYTLKGKGWVRVLAGSQSLLGAYLIVLWLFTYFGRPFEW